MRWKVVIEYPDGMEVSDGYENMSVALRLAADYTAMVEDGEIESVALYDMWSNELKFWYSRSDMG